MHFRIYQDEKGDWRWAIYQSSNLKMAESAVSFWDKQECLAAVDAMRKTNIAPIFFKSPPAEQETRKRKPRKVEILEAV